MLELRAVTRAAKQMPDIHALELEFAKNPTLESCIPLCEAYLTAQRFMEAMVVCKKGIKAAPQDPRGYVMLARVYADQGKLPKAQQELEQAMQQFPGNPWGLEFQGRLLMLQGNRDGAVQFLQQALMTNPQLQNARKWLMEMGIQVPAAMPQAAAMPAARPAAAPQQMPQQRAMPSAMPGMAMPGGAMPQQMPRPGMAPPGPMPQPGIVPGVMPQQQMPRPGMAPPGARPGMPGMPGQMPPGMPQQMPPGAPQQMPRPGMPLGQMPGQMRPGAVPGAGPAPGFGAQPSLVPTSETVPKEEHHLEHVSDFFAPDSLGFRDGDTSHIETAGPGRLTIVGFVPKTSGSIKTTIIVALGFFAVAAGVITTVYKNSQDSKAIKKQLEVIKDALDGDTYVDYQNLLRAADKIFKIDDTHGATLSTVGYTYAVLASDHLEDDALGKAKQFIQRAAAVVGDEKNPWLVSGQALIAYLDGNYDQGLAALKGTENSSSALVHMEALRLRLTTDPDGKETELQQRKLKSVTTSEARAFMFLGWYHYGIEDWGGAGKSFSSALQSSREHPRAMLGQALVNLDRNVGLKELQKEVEQDIKKVFSLPKDELSQLDLAYAHFTRSQLAEWRGERDKALEDYKKAVSIDPKNPFFPFRRGAMLLRSNKGAEAVDLFKDAARLQPTNIRIQRRLIEALIQTKSFVEARTTLDKAQSTWPDHANLLLLEAELLLAERKLDQAVSAFKKLDLGKHGHKALVAAKVGISRATREGGDGAKAAKGIEEFLKQAPAQVAGDKEAQSQLWCEMGLGYDKAGNKTAAQTSYQSGLDIFSYAADCNFYLCRSLGRGPEAVEACKRYLTLDPNGRFAEEAQKRVPKQP